MTDIINSSCVEQVQLTSADIDQLLPALITARATIPPVRKSSVNDHFGNRYADLRELEAAALPALLAHGLVLTHHLVRDDRGELLLVTRLYHASGQWLQSTVPIEADRSSQAMGSATTYGKRYSLQALLSLAADEDDDGNAIGTGGATASPSVPSRTRSPPKERVSQPDPAGEWIDRIRACPALAELATLVQEINVGGDVATKRNRALRTAIVERRTELERLAVDAAGLNWSGGEP